MAIFYQKYKKLGIQPKYTTLHREIESFEVLKRVQSALSRTTSSPLMNSFGSVGGLTGRWTVFCHPGLGWSLGFILGLTLRSGRVHLS